MNLINQLYGAAKKRDEILTDGHFEYVLDVYDIDATVYESCAVYAFVALFGGERIKYIGKADNLSERLSGHERKQEAKTLGANELWVHVPKLLNVVGYLEAEKRLIRRFQPPLNRTYR